MRLDAYAAAPSGAATIAELPALERETCGLLRVLAEGLSPAVGQVGEELLNALLTRHPAVLWQPKCALTACSYSARVSSR